MGHWGGSILENDEMYDILAEFKESQSFEFLEELIESFDDNDGFIDIDYCYSIVAVAEITAAIKNNISDYYPKEFRIDFSRFKYNLSEDFLKKIRKLLKQVLLSEESELFQLFEDKDFLQNVFDDLVKRMSA